MRPLWRALTLARGPEGDRAAVRPWLAGIARTWTERLARLHAAGWAHADVQPADTLVTHDGHAAVIDYALACGPATDRRVPYRGALHPHHRPESPPRSSPPPPTPTFPPSRPPASGAWAPPCSGAGPATAASPTTTPPTGWRSRPPSPRAPPQRCATSGRGPFPNPEDAITACLAPTPPTAPP
ncbi:hypothetical protein ABR737_03510 [Streptomyces sp. Edi2]|uniref:hypothetical protein n=1 Tax=Streptomyces sp. Edi2 TaxID=3162528 RepID=UPI0033065ECD